MCIMQITERQKLILGKIVDEFVDTAEPISSQRLEEKYDFSICPATIRIEMQKLTDGGFLQQPHTSAGRIPTDKAYRLFVNDILEENINEFDKRFLQEIREIENEFMESMQFAQILTKKLADFTSNLALSYLNEEEVVLKEGWSEIVREPEFIDSDSLIRFTEMIEGWEHNIIDFNFPAKIQVFIGRENPLPKSQGFSVIVSKLRLPKEKKGIVAIFGPKRMDYNRNISAINSLAKLLEAYD